MKYRLLLWMAFCLSFTIICADADANDALRFEISTKKVMFVSITPPLFGKYNVVVHLFDSSELAKLTGNNIGKNINITMLDQVLASPQIKARIESGQIGVGRFDSLSEALSRAEFLLSNLNDGK